MNTYSATDKRFDMWAMEKGQYGLEMKTNTIDIKLILSKKETAELVKLILEVVNLKTIITEDFKE